MRYMYLGLLLEPPIPARKFPGRGGRREEALRHADTFAGTGREASAEKGGGTGIVGLREWNRHGTSCRPAAAQKGTSERGLFAQRSA